MSKGRMMYLGLVGALFAALYLTRVYAGDPDPGHTGIIQVLLAL
jgi:hypothetical protein